MTSEVKEQTPIHTYELTCTDCPFATTVDGDLHDALDAAEEHQEEHGKLPSDHFVDLERAGGNE